MARKLLFLNGLAIISVILYHASSWGFTAMFWWAHRYRPVGEVNFDQLGNAEYYGLRMVEQLIIFAIPAFVFVSGYFVVVAAGREGKTLGWGTVLNRIKVLAIPFVIWSVISLIFFALFGERYGLLESLWIIISGKAAGPYYFIPLLVQLYLLSPVLLFLVRKRWKLVLAVCAIIQVVVLSLRYILIFRPDLTLLWKLSAGVLFTSFIFWFVLGIVIGLYLPQFKSTLTKYKRWFLFGVLFFFVAGVVEWELLFHFSGREWIRKAETLIDHLYALSVILSFLSFEKIRLPLNEQVTDMGAKSYAIYLAHPIVQVAVVKLIYHLVPIVMEYQILYQLILIFMGLAIPLSLTYFVERTFLRSYYRYIFG